jgi:hypothetical protein
LSEIIARYQAESGPESELSLALAKIENLSDDEVQKLLENSN